MGGGGGAVESSHYVCVCVSVFVGVCVCDVGVCVCVCVWVGGWVFFAHCVPVERKRGVGIKPPIASVGVQLPL